MFSKDTISAIQSVSGIIAGDALENFNEEEYGCTEAELMAEMTLDANRLALHGHPEAEAELKTLLETNSWVDVCKAAEAHVCY